LVVYIEDIEKFVIRKRLMQKKFVQLSFLRIGCALGCIPDVFYALGYAPDIFVIDSMLIWI
jgi:voltage-gated potassium channel Kch